jgi:hypothetical protein
VNLGHEVRNSSTDPDISTSPYNFGTSVIGPYTVQGKRELKSSISAEVDRPRISGHRVDLR